MFHSARIKLTTWYLLIMFVVSSFFSLTVYRVLSIEVDRFVTMQKSKMERRMLDPDFLPSEMRQRFPTPPVAFVIDEELISETKTRIALSLLIVDGAILAISGMLAYFLAGKTLKPISNMVEEQKRFIGDASHELRTPLTALKSAIEVNLRDKNMSLDDAKELLSCAKDQVDRLTILSNSLLELSRHESNEGNEKSLSEITGISEVVENVMSEMSAMANERKILLKSDLEPLALTNVPKSEMYRLVSILIDNAIKYSDSGTEVFVSLTKTKNWASLKVKDQGIGIDKADIPSIFKRFFRADGARSKAGLDGYGLGLSIAQKIVHKYRGKISVVSKSREGSTFEVLLPLSKQHKN